MAKINRIAYMNHLIVEEPFDIPLVASIGCHGSGVGGGGEHTGVFTYAYTQGIALNGAVRLDIDTRKAFL